MKRGYTEPRTFIERPDRLSNRFHIITVVVAVIILAVGVFAAVKMGQLPPTFNGEVDVAALNENPTAYNLENADGAGYVIVANNNEDTTTKNVTFSVVFNYRGFDTMGESFVLIAALAGALCILRIPGRKAVKETEDEVNKRTGPRARSVIVRYAANLFLPLACTFGGYVILHGDSSPGGGFQGGVLVASAVLLVFLAYGSRSLGKAFKSDFLHNTETIAEIIYIAVGLIGILVGLNFATNIILEKLQFETSILMNTAVGYHVMAGVGCMLIMLLGMLSAGRSDDHVEDPDMVEMNYEEDGKK